MTNLDTINPMLLEAIKDGLDRKFILDRWKSEADTDSNSILIFLDEGERSALFKRDIKEMKDKAECINSVPEGGFISYVYPISKTYVEVYFIFNEERWNNF